MAESEQHDTMVLYTKLSIKDLQEQVPQVIYCTTSFPVIHKVGNVDIFVLLKFENKLDRGINHFNLNSKDCDKM